MEILRSDAHRKLELVMKDEEMLGGQSGTYTRAQSHSVLDTPGQWLFTLTSVCRFAGVVILHRHEERARYGEVHLRPNLSQIISHTYNHIKR